MYQDIYGLSPDRFGLIFGFTGLSVMLGAIGNSRLVKNRKIQSVAKAGVLLIILGSLLAFIASLTVGPAAVAGGFALALFGLGLAEPALIALIMSSQKKALGSTAALMGAMHLILSSLATPITGYLLPISLSGWFIFLIIVGLLSLGLTIMAGRLAPGEKKRP